MKGIHKYNQGQRRPKWKAPRGSTFNAQAPVVGKGKGAKKKVEGQEKPHEENA
jgi:hypothetical protein